MEKSDTNVTSTKAYAPTSEAPLTVEEEDAIVTLVIIVIGIIIAIVVLFCMGILIDCKHQKKNVVKKRRLRLKMPPLMRARGSRRDDMKALAADMCPSGTSNNPFKARDAIV